MTKTTTISAEVFEAAEALALMLEVKYDASIQGLQRWFRQAGYKVNIGSGAYRYAVIMDGGVIKIGRGHERFYALRNECAFINEMRNNEKYARHFPETYEITIDTVPVLVQEKIKMGHDGLWDLHDDVERLATHLGIEDMHDENFGWKGEPGREYPVFIDVDLRNGFCKFKKRSWIVTRKGRKSRSTPPRGTYSW